MEFVSLARTETISRSVESSAFISVRRNAHDWRNKVKTIKKLYYTDDKWTTADPSIPVLPYNETSGWSGTETSRDRAISNDRNGTTKSNQERTLRALLDSGSDGLTWRELADLTNWHHGTASGVLSVLHKEGMIYRLKSKRNRCKVYVHPTYLNSRDYEVQGRKQKECPNCGHAL
jgi:hypothetical protein